MECCTSYPRSHRNLIEKVLSSPVLVFIYGNDKHHKINENCIPTSRMHFKWKFSHQFPIIARSVTILDTISQRLLYLFPFSDRFTHLQHAPFIFTIQIDNDSDAQRMGFVRIFMAPKNDERGQPMLFRDQRLFMVEMDKFLVAREFLAYSTPPLWQLCLTFDVQFQCVPGRTASGADRPSPP